VRLDLYLQQSNAKANEVCKIAKKKIRIQQEQRAIYSLFKNLSF
jgi:hypothetical protein